MADLTTVEKAKRRVRVYRGRVARMAPGTGLRHRCAFMHVPKCGGTSLSEALYALVPLHKEIGVLDSPSIRRAMALREAGVDDRVTFHDEGAHADKVARFRETLLLMHMAHGATLVHGHFLFSERAYERFGDDYRYVTILREPIARTVSNYRMAHENGVFPGTLDEFLDSEMGRRMAQHGLRYFAGQATVAEGTESALLERAKANMARFSVIGFLEELPAFTSAFGDTFGVRPSVGHSNRGAGERPKVTDAQMRCLEELCAPDIELNRHARTLGACA